MTRSSDAPEKVRQRPAAETAGKRGTSARAKGKGRIATSEASAAQGDPNTASAALPSGEPLLRLSRKTLFAVEAVVDIAHNGRVDPVQAKEITARQGVPHRYLEQVMQQLVHLGVLKGVRGPRGGYVLARERRRISVGDIVRVVSAMEGGEDGGGASASSLAEKVITPMWDAAQARFLAELDAVTIADLCVEAEARKVARDGPDANDFTI